MNAEDTKVTVDPQKATVAEVEDDEVVEESGKPEGDLKVALQVERSRRKDTQKQLKTLQEEVSKIKPLAEEYAALLPYLPTILNNNSQVQQRQQQQQVDEEAVEFATIMGYETEEGQPDVRRARAALDFQDRRMGRVVDRKVQPALNESATARAQQIRERAYNAKDEDGNPYASRQAIDNVFSKIPPHVLTNPDNAVAALIMARGLGGPGKLEQVDEPLHIERGGGRRLTRTQEVSDIGKQIAQMRGKSEKEWQGNYDTPAESGWDLE